MGRDITIFGMDVDEALVRRVLDSIPGATPLPEELADGNRGRSGSAAASSGPEDADSSGATAPPDDADGARRADRRADASDPTSGSADPSADAADSTPEGPDGAPRSGVAAPGDAAGVGRAATPDGDGPPHRKDNPWRQPSGADDAETPWPGAPPERPPDEGRNWRAIGAGVGLIATTGLLGIAAVYGYRRYKRRRAPGTPGPLASVRRRLGRGDGEDDADLAGDPADTDETDERPASERLPGDRSPDIDWQPLVGLGFLATLSLVLRHLYDDE